MNGHFHNFEAHRNDWESRFFRREIWTIKLAARGGRSLSEILTEKSGVDLWEMRISISQTNIIYELLQSGFFVSDSACDFALDLKAFEKKSLTSGLAIHRATHNDLAEIEALIDQAEFPTRFMRQPFSEYEGHEFYKTWARNAIAGTFDDLCLVAKCHGEIEAFLTLGRGDDEEARVGIVSTLKSARGKGLGTSLHYAAADIAKDWGKLRLLISTQMINQNMIRLLSNLGARPISSKLTFYKTV